MNDANFITNRKAIQKLTSKMTQIESDGWETKYLDKIGNSEWKEVQLNSEYHGGGGNSILFKHPKPNQSELIKILTQLTEINKISAVSSLIKNFEYDIFNNHNEYREELILALEAIINGDNFKLTRFERKRLSIIIENTGLNHTFNHRESLEKKYSEVENDYQYYKKIAERAQDIIAITNNDQNSLCQKIKLMLKL